MGICLQIAKMGGGLTNKAFTLIELLTVIIILAVIALIATPIVLNVVENAKKQANKNSVYGIMDSARLYYTESLLDGSKSSNINGTTNLIDEISVSGKKPDSGVLYINEDGKIAIALVYDNVCYKKNFTEKDLTESEDISNCTLNIEETPTVPKVCSVTEGTGENIGDVITCGTESFYVINTTGTNIKMLAMYNLKVGGIYNTNTSTSTYTPYTESEMTYLQYGDMKGYVNGLVERKGTTAFSSNTKKGTKYSSYSGSIVQGYVDTYKTMLENMGVNVIDASLITKAELIALGCNDGSHTCSTAPTFVSGTTYWSGSADNADIVWSVYSDGNFFSNLYSLDYIFGVRPVITISKNDIEI